MNDALALPSTLETQQEKMGLCLDCLYHAAPGPSSASHSLLSFTSTCLRPCVHHVCSSRLPGAWRDRRLSPRRLCYTILLFEPQFRSESALVHWGCVTKYRGLEHDGMEVPFCFHGSTLHGPCRGDQDVPEHKPGAQLPCELLEGRDFFSPSPFPG